MEDARIDAFFNINDGANEAPLLLKDKKRRKKTTSPDELSPSEGDYMAEEVRFQAIILVENLANVF